MQRPELTTSQRLELLERALEVLEAARRLGKRIKDDDLSPLQLAIAELLTDASEYERALPWYQKALAAEPLEPIAVNNYVGLLSKLGKWLELAEFAKDQIRRFGELPGRLYTCGRALFEAGEYSNALPYLFKAKKLAEPGHKIREFAERCIDEALETGAKLPDGIPPEYRIIAPLSKNELEYSIDRFAGTVQAGLRMRFWRLGPGDDHKWTENPERLAQSLLHAHLKGAFDDRIEVLEEVGVGAGRLDLYLLLRGGLRAIVELKMCGDPYTSTYAFSGADQIGHYMTNKVTNLGFLVIFDARRRDFAQGLQPVERIGNHTIVTKFIDVRPDVTLKRKTHKPT